MAVQTLADAAVVIRADVTRVSDDARRGGKVAGEAAGQEMARGIDTQLRNSRGRFTRSGQTVGASVGEGANRGFLAKIRGKFESSGGSAAKNFAKGFGNDTGAFSRVIATMAARVTLAAAALAATAPGVAHLTAALIPATGAAVALPAALLSVVAAASVLKIATAGVGNAIQKGFTGASKQAKEELDKLPPSARRFAAAIIALKPRIDALRRSVAGRFFAPLQNEVRPLANLYFPMLRLRMAEVAGESGKLAERVAHAARQTVVFRAVSGIFDAVGASVARLRSGVGPLVRGFAALINATVPLLPQMASWLARVAANVGNYVRQASASGRVVAIFRNAVATLRLLGQIAGNVGSILATVWHQADASGANLLARIRDLTGQARAFVQSGQGMATIASIFRTMASLGDALRTGLGAALPAVAQSLQIAGPALARFAQAAANLVVQLAPLLPHVTQLAVQILTALLPAIISLTGWMQRNQGTVQRLAPVVVGLVSAMYAYRAALAVAAVATRVWAVAVGVAKVAQVGWTAITWLATAPVHAHTAAMALSRSTIGTWIGVKAIEVGAWVRSTAASVASTAGVVANRVAMVAHAVASRAAAAATIIWTAATNGAAIAMRVAGIALRFMSGPIGIIITVIALLAAGIVYLWRHNETFRRIVLAVWGAVKVFIAGVVTWFRVVAVGYIKAAIDFMVGYYKFLWSIVKFIFNLIKSWITIQINAVRAVFTAFGRFFTVTVPGWFRTGQRFISEIINFWRADITRRVDAVKSVLSALGRFVTVTIPNAFRDGVKAIGNFWRGLQELARKPVAFVVNQIINPFLGGFKRVAGVFGVKTPEPIHGFQEGGQIPGPASVRDNRIAWLRNAAGRVIGNIAVATGEFVVNAKDTAKALPLLRWINDGMRGGPVEAARRIGRPPVERMGDGSDGGWAFAKGGLVGFLSDVWGAISDPKKLIVKPIEEMVGRIPGAGFVKDLLIGMGRKLVSGFTNWLTGGAGGGTLAGNIGEAQRFVRAQAGKPYFWASAGPHGYDCSGIVAAVYNLLKGRNPYSHIFSTGQLPGNWFHEGVRAGALMAGWAHPGQRGASASVGHMAGMVGGLPFESTGSTGVRVGAAARKVTEFAHIGAARASGGLVELRKVARFTQADFGAVTLAPGANLVYNGLGRAERLEEPADGAPSPRMHPDDIAALADAIGATLGRALLGTVPATRVAARQAGRGRTR